LGVDTLSQWPYVDPIEFNAMERKMNTEQTTNLWQYLTRTVPGRAWVAILVLSVLSSLLFTCSAQAREVYDTQDGQIVRHANCLLVGNGMKAKGTCSVGRNPVTNNTTVIMNQLLMLIERTDERGTAHAYIIEDDTTLTPISTVVAVGNCWVGHRFRFCAN
jgi:hypothetical protein